MPEIHWLFRIQTINICKIESLSIVEIADLISTELYIEYCMIQSTIAEKYRRLVPAAFMLILIGCTHYIDYKPDPVKDIDQWVENFANQRSFVYHYEVRTTSVYTEAQGVCLIGIGEHVTGVWRADEQETKFEYYGLYDHEYEKQNGHWADAVRGEQTDILTQIERILEFDEFEYLPEDEKYTYCFKTNAAFLSPMRRKEMIGRMKFSSRDYRPTEIWTGLPDSSVYWTVRISGYNRRHEIQPPILKWRKHTVELAGHSRALKKRLARIGIPHRVKTVGKEVEIEIPDYISSDELQRCLARVDITVSGIVDARVAERAVEIGDNKAPVYVGERIFSGRDVQGGRTGFDGIGRPFLELSLRKPYDIPARLLVEISDDMPQIVNVDKAGKMRKIRLYIDKTFHDMRILRAQLLQPLPDVDLGF